MEAVASEQSTLWEPVSPASFWVRWWEHWPCTATRSDTIAVTPWHRNTWGHHWCRPRATHMCLTPSTKTTSPPSPRHLEESFKKRLLSSGTASGRRYTQTTISEIITKDKQSKRNCCCNLQGHHAVDRSIADRITACRLLCKADLFGLTF